MTVKDDRPARWDTPRVVRTDDTPANDSGEPDKPFPNCPIGRAKCPCYNSPTDSCHHQAEAERDNLKLRLEALAEAINRYDDSILDSYVQEEREKRGLKP